MAKYRVTTPVAEVTGEIGGVMFVRGVAEVDAPEPLGRMAEGASLSRDEAAQRSAVGQHPGYRAMAYFRSAGYGIERLDADPQPEAAVEAAAEPGDKTPARSASKSDWKAYAVGQGMSEEDAEKASRDELAEKFLGPKGA